MSVKSARLTFTHESAGYSEDATCAFCGRLTASLMLEVEHSTLLVFRSRVEVPICLSCLERAIDDMDTAPDGQQDDSGAPEQNESEMPAGNELPVYEHAVLNVPRKVEEMYKVLQAYGDRGWHLGSVIPDSQGLTPIWTIVFERDTNSVAPGAEEEDYEEQEEEPVEITAPLPPLAPPSEVHTKMEIPAPAETATH
jgi:hypothetical protein